MDSPAFKAFEAEGWDRRARSYDLVTGAVTRRAAEPLLDAAGVGRATRLLDVATGPGHLAAAARRRGARVTGVDLAAGMLALARERVPDAEMVVADAEELPFAAGAFDALVAGFVLNHLPSPERAVSGWARVLAPGARMAATVWERPPRCRLVTLLGEAIEAAGLDPAAGVPAGPDPFRFADHGELAALLEGAGLCEVSVTTLDLLHEVHSTDELWDGLLGGSVRSSGAVESQPAARDRIRAEFDRLVGELWNGRGYAVPAAVRLASGARP